MYLIETDQLLQINVANLTPFWKQLLLDNHNLHKNLHLLVKRPCQKGHCKGLKKGSNVDYFVVFLKNLHIFPNQCSYLFINCFNSISFGAIDTFHTAKYCKTNGNQAGLNRFEIKSICEQWWGPEQIAFSIT